MRKRKRLATIIAALFLLAGGWGVVLWSSEERRLTEKDWEKLRRGELVKEVKKEAGTQSAAWSAGLFHHPPDLIWKVICSLELYDEYFARTTVSVLLDEAAKERVLANADKSAAEIEKLFAGMEPGYVKKEPDGRWTVYSYQRNALPWPVNDRWVLLEITHDDRAKKQTWHRLAGNIKEDFGFWQVIPVPDNPGQAVAINEIHLDLDIPATGPFTAFAMEVSLPETYQAFAQMAADLAKEGPAP